MHTTTATAPRPAAAARLGYAAFAVLMLTAAVLEAVQHGTGYWPMAVFGLGPDVALFVGVGRGLAKGQLHPRAVGLYNLLHRFWGPVALAALASFDVISVGFLIGALAWLFHIALDRAVGYGLRTRDGFQRA
ncbi:MAG: DUF4260 family protein [Actinomycetota bacterium]